MPTATVPSTAPLRTGPPSTLVVPPLGRPAVTDAPEDLSPNTTAPESISLGSLVDNTPDTRDRFVDFLRALSIAVVILWHWVFSITQWSTDNDSLIMPNPIGGVPGLWAATWLLQIMPVFFLVGGYANLAGLDGMTAANADIRPTWRAFVAKRLHRLGKPVGLYVGLWVIGEIVAHALVPGYRGVTTWGMVVFVPLWFLGVYVSVVLLAPFTARLHHRAPWHTLGGLVAGIALADAARFGLGIERAGLLTSALVWVFVHQLGYFWRDGSLVRCGRRALVAVAGGGMLALVLLTTFGPYPRSMVSVTGEGSNMFPTTACIAALAVFQLGVAMLVRPAATRWLQRRRVWSFTVAVNAVAMTVFCWHMTALVAAIAVYEWVGFTLGTEADAAWWAQRPLWLVLPGVFLAALVALFARFELPTPSSRARRSRPNLRSPAESAAEVTG